VASGHAFFLATVQSCDPAIGAGDQRIHLGHRETADALTTTMEDAPIPENRAKSRPAVLGAAVKFAEDVGGQDSGCGRQ
jgi:hypothetical protein